MLNPLPSSTITSDGNFYYTDDKECWQKNFGFNEVYDTFAPVTMMYYDTVRTTFEYGGKEWMIQTWKGQYGVMFVGGEVGVYTRPLGSIGCMLAFNSRGWDGVFVYQRLIRTLPAKNFDYVLNFLF